VSSGGTVWAVGDGNNCGCGPGTSLIERWNGKTWGQMPTPTFGAGVDVNAVASLPSGRLWAVGLSGEGDSPTHGVILQWTGTAWTRVPIPDLKNDDGGLFGLAATSRSNAWAVGWASSGGSASGTPKIMILHWNGSAWKPLIIASSAKTPAGGEASATTTTTLAPTTTTLAPPTTTPSVPAQPTPSVSEFTQWSGSWGAHEQELELSPAGDGQLSYADLTLCPNCSFGSAPTSTMEFQLTSVSGGTASGTVTASSDPTNYPVGQDVTVSLAPGSPGELLEISFAGQGPEEFCNSTSAGQCGA
jgi:hypothetical protein